MTRQRNTTQRKDDGWLRVYLAARIAGCSRQKVLRELLASGKEGKDYQYVGGHLYVQRSAAIALRERLERERATQGAA